MACWSSSRSLYNSARRHASSRRRHAPGRHPLPLPSKPHPRRNLLRHRRALRSRHDAASHAANTRRLLPQHVRARRRRRHDYRRLRTAGRLLRTTGMVDAPHLWRPTRLYSRRRPPRLDGLRPAHRIRSRSSRTCQLPCRAASRRRSRSLPTQRSPHKTSADSRRSIRSPFQRHRTRTPPRPELRPHARNHQYPLHRTRRRRPPQTSREAPRILLHQKRQPATTDHNHLRLWRHSRSHRTQPRSCRRPQRSSLRRLMGRVCPTTRFNHREDN